MIVHCSDCREALIDFAHEELHGTARTTVATHLAQCGDCALEFCRLRADLEGILHAQIQSPGPRVREALRSKVAAEFGPSMWARAWALARRPVPMYGALLVGMIPLALWLTAPQRQAPAAAPIPRASGIEHVVRPARLTDYDAPFALRPLGDVL